MSTESFLIDEGNDTTIISIISQLIFETNLYKKLNAIDTLLSSLDDKIAEKSNAAQFKKYLNTNFLLNVDFMRQLGLFSKMEENVETGLELQGQDYISHPEYVFDKEFAETKANLNKQINHFTGKLLRELTKGESLDL